MILTKSILLEIKLYGIHIMENILNESRCYSIELSSQLSYFPLVTFYRGHWNNYLFSWSVHAYSVVSVVVDHIDNYLTFNKYYVLLFFC